ncbi:MAG: hypothetical protein ISS25_01115 [Nanoarchaeota archaeon]|nr:hypothetical protein [DPANN group archaeon]MBL7116414.1 hypothetical protein [Nanoarchaeota archaeon]
MKRKDVGLKQLKLFYIDDKSDYSARLYHTHSDRLSCFLVHEGDKAVVSAYRNKIMEFEADNIGDAVRQLRENEAGIVDKMREYHVEFIDWSKQLHIANKTIENTIRMIKVGDYSSPYLQNPN